MENNTVQKYYGLHKKVMVICGFGIPACFGSMLQGKPAGRLMESGLLSYCHSVQELFISRECLQGISSTNETKSASRLSGVSGRSLSYVATRSLLYQNHFKLAPIDLRLSKKWVIDAFFKALIKTWSLDE